ncbi:putative periplasmic protease [Neisseria meningitidis]|nr:putative periplasmic protease [Neisseria meningitidis]CWN09197.1 putative periplasmic protease [Neisseria meningitidis]CWN59341.1 putative periplasmic protease [Neisseria meningitidis]CWQ73853.1 putative periplasmic protease [Neisseria meningitidis]CWQ85179.1 putative periplasmic protease [Neisseria meningitidis]
MGNIDMFMPEQEEIQSMWKEILLNYGIFLLELLTVFGAIALIVLAIVQSKKQSESGSVVLTDFSENYKKQRQSFEAFFLSGEEAKHQEKEEKKKEKAEAKAEKKRLKEGGEKSSETQKSRLFVLDFDGDLYAHAVESLRHEITAVLLIAKPEDEVLLRLESPGGVVHGYGLAASQLRRLRERNIPLTVAVDKVAASGGYMMACVANKIVSAPFAIVGSVGVVAEVPNIHRLLKKHDIDVDVMTAGEFKRTVTFMGENTEKGKQKFRQELEETHQLFKQFVSENRPQLDIEEVATGEHWFGRQALALNLIDEISTSDDLLLKAFENKQVIEVKYQEKQSLIQRIGLQAEASVEKLFAKLVNRRADVM